MLGYVFQFRNFYASTKKYKIRSVIFPRKAKILVTLMVKLIPHIMIGRYTVTLDMATSSVEEISKYK